MSSASSSGQTPALAHRRGPLFWATAVAGWLIIGWGVRGALIHRIDTRPTQLARFFADGALLHDLVFAPVVLAVGFVVARLVPGRWRAPVQAFLIVTGCLALFAWAEVRNYARVNHNPTSLPHNYTANLLLVVALVCVGTAAGTVVLRVRAGRRRSG